MTQISIAVPDSFLAGSQSLLEKSIKISQLARASAIFRVDNIFIYRDFSIRTDTRDVNITRIILEYLDTPPYLRKSLFPQTWILKHAGMLPPIKAPHHKSKISSRDLKIGDVRVGITLKLNGIIYANVGLESPIALPESNMSNKKIIVKVIALCPKITGIEIHKEKLEGYWGYTVRYSSSLKALLRSYNLDEIIITSIQGRSISEKEFSGSMQRKICRIKDLLVVFGSPNSGLKKIMKCEDLEVSHFPFVINMFPNQGTETVRVEEAILGTLSILNKEINVF